MKSHPGFQQRQEAPRFINPHRLFHGVWLPQWLEERPAVSEKAKKLYAYLTYFAGGKGYAWPSFNHLAGKLHISRRYVIKLVQELSAHSLIVATSVNVPTKGHCTNHYRFLWHPWMQTARDGDFSLVVHEEKPPFRAAESRQSILPPSEQQSTSPSELQDTSPGEPQITPLVTHSSPKEINRKRTNKKGKLPVARLPQSLRPEFLFHSLKGSARGGGVLNHGSRKRLPDVDHAREVDSYDSAKSGRQCLAQFRDLLGRENARRVIVQQEAEPRGFLQFFNRRTGGREPLTHDHSPRTILGSRLISEDGESSKCFGFVNRYDTRPKRRLFEMLKSQGMQMNQAVTFLSAAPLSAISKCTSTRGPSIFWIGSTFR